MMVFFFKSALIGIIVLSFVR
jgi:hypothetical protein